MLKVDDLPRRYGANPNTDPPFERKPGEKSALSEAEIEDVVAFLNTPTDEYSARNENSALQERRGCVAEGR